MDTRIAFLAGMAVVQGFVAEVTPGHAIINDEVLSAFVKLAPLVFVAAGGSLARILHRRNGQETAKPVAVAWYLRSMFFGSFLGGVVFGALAIQYSLSFWWSIFIVAVIGLFADETMSWMSNRYRSGLDRAFNRILPPGQQGADGEGTEG